MNAWEVAGRRLVRLLPARNRMWGQALLAELDAIPRRHRPRWVFGLASLTATLWAREAAVRFQRRPAGGGNVSTGLSIGGVAGLLVAAELVYSNLGPASSHPVSDTAGPVLVAGALLGLLFVAIGVTQRIRGQSIAGCARAAAIAATVIVAFAFLTVMAVDNLWLHTVARQPDKIYGLEHSPLFHTMRGYLIGQDLLGLVVVTPVAALFAAALGALAGRAACVPCRSRSGSPTARR